MKFTAAQRGLRGLEVSAFPNFKLLRSNRGPTTDEVMMHSNEVLHRYLLGLPFLGCCDRYDVAGNIPKNKSAASHNTKLSIRHYM